ncbi:MAG TPA: sulfate ABC transporter permease subunit CysT, partial [Firmicutes bacterium]|nr:sulfate ABC transporter permease subunit CysT [Bacillota bacterium]
MALIRKHTSVLPGFGLSMGFTLAFLSLVVLIPLAALFLKASSMDWKQLWETISAPRVVASFRLSFSAAFCAATVNALFGLLVAWVLVRYRFAGKRMVDALVDLPFALPTAVAGIALTAIYSTHGWVGQLLAPLSVQVAYTPIGVTIALTFVGLPFVVRTVQPVLQDMGVEFEEAAASLGAGRVQTVSRVIFPILLPALLTGFALSFARALGEYGSVVFISGNMPMRTEIAPLLIVT